MDRSEQILQALAAACAVTGYTVQIDRPQPLDDADAPLIILRTGEETTAALDPARWWSRWEMRPTIQIYVVAEDPSAARATLNTAWAAIIGAIRTGTVPRLIALKTGIEMEKGPLLYDGGSYAQEMTLALTFDR